MGEFVNFSGTINASGEMDVSWNLSGITDTSGYYIEAFNAEAEAPPMNFYYNNLQMPLRRNQVPLQYNISGDTSTDWFNLSGGNSELRFEWVDDLPDAAHHISVHLVYWDGESGDGVEEGKVTITPSGDELNFVWLAVDENGLYPEEEDDEVVEDGEEDTPCFPGDTLIETDQGEIMIKNITTKNTIHGAPVKKLLKARFTEESIIKIKQNAFGHNIPKRDTFITSGHGIYVKSNEFVRARDLVGNKMITKFPFNETFVYNILLPEYSYMYVNDICCETLNPAYKKMLKK